MAELIYQDDGKVMALLSEAEWALVSTADGTAPPLTGKGIILPIPHVSQLGSGADARRGDCGAACAVMCIQGMTHHRPTVDAIAKAYQNARVNRSMTMSEVMQALRGYELRSDYVRPLRPEGIRQQVRQGHPVIALVKYPLMPHQFSDYRWSHFIVVYGVVDGAFLYHDPLAPMGTDVRLVLTADELDAAMRGFGENENLPYQGIVVSG